MCDLIVSHPLPGPLPLREREDLCGPAGAKSQQMGQNGITDMQR